VYDTQRRITGKLSAPETISRFTDTAGAHQKLNGLRDLTTYEIHGLALATVNLSTKFEVSNSTHYEDMKGDTKCRK